ncbi:hypothetical protein [Peribacillus asahii]|uniref:Uncharacterized protein n=1 Tax=Peribacillus asahii TaxID=228899 RepID=A0A3Q9RN36_9BACI|nr:hypothetical protein [Peribacillus asahii]AZV42930.1 hypothetical protein BAOM_2321 [Peribacillus asahii]USK87137.1 hypothetical protein LIT35_11160 [Peribacillus asahii]
MEQRIEKSINHVLESASSQLYIFSIGLGIVLVILGISLFLSGKRTKGKTGKINTGLICAVIGIVAIVSGTIQI